MTWRDESKGGANGGRPNAKRDKASILRLKGAAMSGRAMWIVPGIAKPPLLISASERSTGFPSTSTFTSEEAVISSYSMPKVLIRK